MSEHITVSLDIEVNEALEELQDFSNKVDELGTRWQRVKRTVQQESRHLMYSMAGLIRLVQAVFAQVGISFGPVGDAIMRIVNVIISSAIAMQYAYVAGGPVGWAMIGIAAAALGLALRAELQASIGLADAKNDMKNVNTALSSLTSILGPWRF